MPSYSYTAVDKFGKDKKGVIEAESEASARALLKESGSVVLSIKEAGMLSKNIDLGSIGKRPKPRDFAVFCRQFVSITSAGVPIVSAFEMLSKQTENKILSEAIFDCCTSMQSGSSLSDAMLNRSDVFPSLLITMAASGEASGSLDIAFDRMATQFEKDAKLQQMIKRTSTYPIVIAVVAFAVVFLILTYAVPQFEEMLTQLDTELPLLTKIVIAAGDFAGAYWYYILGAIAALIFGFIAFKRTEEGKRHLGNLQLKLPLFGTLAVKVASARMCRTFATLTAAGVPLVQTLEIVSNVMTNTLFKDALIDNKEAVMMGTPFSEAIATGPFPPLVEHMTKIGEETGDIEKMYNKLADYYDDEVENATAVLMSVLEPAIIVFLAVIIGAIVFAVILPISEMYVALDNL